MTKTPLQRAWDVITSFQLTIFAMALLMVLVVLCTLAQVELGTLGAVNVYMRSFIVWWSPAGATTKLPIFPGGALVGLALLVNLVGAMVKRLQFTWNKAGLWIVHAGLILLFVGEFVTGAMQQDMRMAIETGQTVNYLESPKAVELAIIDQTDPASDEVVAIPASVLAKGGAISLPGTPLTLNVKRFFLNAELSQRQPNQPGSGATMGVGANVSIEERPGVSKDDDMNQTSALVEPMAGGKSLGVWLTSLALGAPQTFLHEGHAYRFEMRLRRTYLPYTLTLKKFSHDKYPGTEIPKNFSSLVQLTNPTTRESREVLIYMNQPLRYDGKAFYQASFGKGDMLSILQVVENPGWLIPYISCVLVTLGLVVHFGVMLRKSAAKRSA